ncbi:MAG: phosphotransferase, partial [Planctomycetota bacterium]
LRRELRERVYGKLPEAIIHGDLHPGNVKFAGDRVAGFFDFDWANRWERVRDIGDGALFFTSRREEFNGEDIWSLTADFTVDEKAAEAFLTAYDSVSRIEKEERKALGSVLAARWLQSRVRGMRKVGKERRMEFLDRGDLFRVLEAAEGFRGS